MAKNKINSTKFVKKRKKKFFFPFILASFFLSWQETALVSVAVAPFLLLLHALWTEHTRARSSVNLFLLFVIICNTQNKRAHAHIRTLARTTHQSSERDDESMYVWVCGWLCVYMVRAVSVSCSVALRCVHLGFVRVYGCDRINEQQMNVSKFCCCCRCCRCCCECGNVRVCVCVISHTRNSYSREENYALCVNRQLATDSILSARTDDATMTTTTATTKN